MLERKEDEVSVRPVMEVKFCLDTLSRPGRKSNFVCFS